MKKAKAPATTTLRRALSDYASSSGLALVEGQVVIVSGPLPAEIKRVTEAYDGRIPANAKKIDGALFEHMNRTLNAPTAAGWYRRIEVLKLLQWSDADLERAAGYGFPKAAQRVTGRNSSEAIFRTKDVDAWIAGVRALLKG